LDSDEFITNLIHNAVCLQQCFGQISNIKHHIIYSNCYPLSYLLSDALK